MKDKYAELDREVKDWINKNEQHLNECYSEYVADMRDSMEHKSFMINNDDCFYEWCEEEFDKISLSD